MKHPSLFLSLTACAALSTLPAHAAPFQLSAAALQQMAALEAVADSRTPAQQKISSRLLDTLRMARGQQIAPGVQSLRTGVNIDGAGLALVDVDGDITPALLQTVVRVGGDVVHASAEFGQARVRVPLSALETLASVSGVHFLKPAVGAQLSNPAPRRVDFLAPFALPVPTERVSIAGRKAAVRAALPGLLSRLAANVPGPVSNTGSETSEGDKAHGADKARSAFHVDGTGVKVGVLSDSLDDSVGSYADAKASGDVSTVTVIKDKNGKLQDGGTGEAEGLAMLEIVHDLAPKASLYFATGFNGEASMADNIVALQKAGCRVIIDDVSYFDEPPFQDGIIAKAVNTVTAAGALFFSSAANYGNADDYSSSVWEGDFKDSGKTQSGGKLHDFSGLGDTGNETDIAPDSAYVSLFWADPLGKSSNDYDLFIFDANGTRVVASSTDRQTGTQDPIEMAPVQYGEHAAVVLHKGAGRFLHLDINAQNSLLGFSTAGRTRGHNAGLNTFSCAAADANDAYPDMFSTGNVTEGFSSDGPRRVFFSPDGTAITPGNFLHTGGTALKKPDFTAADGVTTTLPYAQGLNPFYGTSAAAPHAGAIAVLMLSRNKTLTRAQVASILDSTATDIDAGGYDRNSGYGILNALKAVQSTPTSTGIVSISTLVLTPTFVTGGTGSTGKITLSAAAPAGGATISLKSSDTNSATVPASVTIAAGSKSVSFTVTTKAVTSVKTPTLTATLGTSVQTAKLTVNPAAVTPASLTFNPNSISSDGQSTGTVTLSGAAPAGGADVAVSYNGNAILTATVPAGATSTTFALNFPAVTSTSTYSLDATLNGKTVSGSVTVKATTVMLSTLSFSPSTVTSGGATTGTVTLTATAPKGGAVVEVYQGDIDLGYLLVPGGQSGASFTFTPSSVTAQTKYTMKATYNNASETTSLTVKP